MKKRYVFLGLLLIIYWSFYLVHFWGYSLSDNSEDWGSFATYFGLSINFISVYYVGKAYCEQIKANKNTLFEKRFSCICDTIQRLQTSYSKNIEFYHSSLYSHFCAQPFDRRKNYSKIECRNLLLYYYSNIKYYKGRNDFETLFDYVESRFEDINNTEIENPEKKNLLIEMLCLMNKEGRVVFFLYLLSQKKLELIEEMKELDFFSFSSNNLRSDSFISILNIAIYGEPPSKVYGDEISRIATLEIETYEKEPYTETFERLRSKGLL